MQIKLWGVRGSIPAPLSGEEYRQRIRAILDEAQKIWKTNKDATPADILSSLPPALTDIVGGETTCVEVYNGTDRIILDIGTGSRKLGYKLANDSPTGVIHLLMTHTHWDHIQGWPFFLPAYMPGYVIHIYSPAKNCYERFETQQHFDYFPVSFDQMLSQKEFHHFQTDDTFQIGSFHVTGTSLIHPGGSTAYRIECNGSCFIFATDTEFFGDNLEEEMKRRENFFRGADLLVIDAQYSYEEAVQRVGWGHTATTIAAECAEYWGVKKVVFTHHEPAHNDARVHSLFKKSKGYANNQQKEGTHIPELLLGVEGAVFTV